VKFGKRFFLFCILFSTLGALPQVWAGPIIHINIKTLLALQDAGPSSPQIKSLTQEYRSVLRYSSYKLLSQNRLNLKLNESGRVSLPGNRIMNITLKGISGNRASLKLEIYKKNRKIFQTVVQLRNRSSITVGGPKYRGGDLLFNIFNYF
jgi:hypothetical protein